jgi:hypothetical protein
MKALLDILALHNAALRNNPAILQENVIEASDLIAKQRKSLKAEAPAPAKTVAPKPERKATAKTPAKTDPATPPAATK